MRRTARGPHGSSPGPVDLADESVDRFEERAVAGWPHWDVIAMRALTTMRGEDAAFAGLGFGEPSTALNRRGSGAGRANDPSRSVDLDKVALAETGRRIASPDDGPAARTGGSIRDTGDAEAPDRLSATMSRDALDGHRSRRSIPVPLH